MSDSAPFAFEAPNFPSDDDIDDETDEDLDDDEELDDEVDGNEVDANEVEEAEVEEPDDSVNRVDGGTARSVLDFLARSIVDDPDAVAIEVGQHRGQTRLSLHVAPGDMGRVIGKRGRVAQAIRAVVRAAAARDSADATVDIVD